MPNPLRRAHIYVTEGEPAIVAPLFFNSAGICYEQDDPIVARTNMWEDVVPSLRTALERFSFCEANLRNNRLVDWPSFRASGAKSVSAFEEEYICIQIVAVNDAELFYDASSKPQNEPDIELHVSLNRYGSDEEIARLLGRLFDACLHWSSVGLPL